MGWRKITGVKFNDVVGAQRLSLYWDYPIRSYIQVTCHTLFKHLFVVYLISVESVCFSTPLQLRSHLLYSSS